MERELATEGAHRRALFAVVARQQLDNERRPVAGVKDGGRVARVLRSEMWVSAEEARDQRCSPCRPLQRASRPCWGRSPRSAIATVSEEGIGELTEMTVPPVGTGGSTTESGKIGWKGVVMKETETTIDRHEMLIATGGGMRREHSRCIARGRVNESEIQITLCDKREILVRVLQRQFREGENHFDRDFETLIPDNVEPPSLWGCGVTDVVRMQPHRTGDVRATRAARVMLQLRR